MKTEKEVLKRLEDRLQEAYESWGGLTECNQQSNLSLRDPNNGARC